VNNENKILSMLETLTSDMAELKTDVAELKTDVAELKTDVAELKTDMAEVKEKLTEVHGTTELLVEWADIVGSQMGVSLASVAAAKES